MVAAAIILRSALLGSRSLGTSIESDPLIVLLREEVLPVPLDELPVDDVAAPLAEQLIDMRVDGGRAAAAR